LFCSGVPYYAAVPVFASSVPYSALLLTLAKLCFTMHFFEGSHADALGQLPAAQVSLSTWSTGGAATFSQPPGLSYPNQSHPSQHYASMPSPAFLQHGPTQAYHRALIAASQPHPSSSWHSSPSTIWHTHAAASGSLTATYPTQTPASAQGCPLAAALGQLLAIVPVQVSATGPLQSSGAASQQPHVSASELPHVSASELPHVSASQALPAQSHLLQKSASAARPHLPPASGTMDLGEHAQTHMQAKLAQQQAVQASTQMPIDLGQHAQTHMQAKFAQKQAVQASTQMPIDLGQHARTHMQAQLAQQQASAQMPEAAAAVSQAVEVSEAASAAAKKADRDAGQPQLLAQLPDSVPFQTFSIAKPVSSAAATREAIRAFQPPLPLSLPAALPSVPEEGTAMTGATALVQPQAGQQLQQLHDRPMVPKLQPRAVTLARQTSLAGPAEPSLQTPAPVSNQLDAQRDILSILFPTLTSAGEAPEQLSQPAMSASVQQYNDKPSSQQFAAEEPADVPMQELAQLLLLKRRELSQKPLQKLPQADQQLQGRCQEQPQDLLPTQPHGQLHLSSQAPCKVAGKQTAADVVGWSAPVTPAFAVAGGQDSVKAEADTELLHSNSSQSAVQLSPLNMGTSPSDQNITQVPDRKGQVATVSVFCTSCTVACRLQ